MALRRTPDDRRPRVGCATTDDADPAVEDAELTVEHFEGALAEIEPRSSDEGGTPGESDAEAAADAR